MSEIWSAVCDSCGWSKDDCHCNRKNPVTIQTLEERILILEDELRSKKNELEKLRKNCKHRWRPTEFVPSYPVNSPWIRKWRRICIDCNFNEYTTKVRVVEVSGPISGTTSKQEEPQFIDYYLP